RGAHYCALSPCGRGPHDVGSKLTRVRGSCHGKTVYAERDPSPERACCWLWCSPLPQGERAQQLPSRRTIAVRPLREADELHPVRLLADGVTVQLGQRAAILVDAVDRHVIRQFTDGGEIAAGGIDVEAARLGLGRDVADRDEPAARAVDLEGRE